MKMPNKAAVGAVPFGQTCIVLDVRTDVEHAETSLKQPHHHIPLDKLNPSAFIKENKIDAARPVYVLCRSGKRATQAAEAFIAAGHDNVHVIEGGIIACEASGIPVKKGNVISLERQVRIVAGLLVVTSVVLGFLVSPWLYGLSAFVGAGLIFAGVTDSCGMAFMLAKAPWNKGLKPAEKVESCGMNSTTCSVSAPQAGMKMPAGTVFYSPASGRAAPAQTREPAKTAGGPGGCS